MDNPWILRKRTFAPGRPKHRSIGQYFQEEIAAVLDSISTSGCLKKFPIKDWLPSRMLIGSCDIPRANSFFSCNDKPASAIRRALLDRSFLWTKTHLCQEFEVPSGGVWNGSRHCPCIQRLCDWWKRAEAARGNTQTAHGTTRRASARIS